jgi:integrase
MVYSFARIGAATHLKVGDVFTQARRPWLRLHEKGGKRHEVPCHHHLETYLAADMEAARLGDDPRAPLFQTLARGRNAGPASWACLSGKPMSQPIAWAMLLAPAADAALDTAVCNVSGPPPPRSGGGRGMA